MHKPAIKVLQERGAIIRTADLGGSDEDLTRVLTDIDIVISCVGAEQQRNQIALANAAKKVGVKRFIPCGFITVVPPGGIMWLRDQVGYIYHRIHWYN
jgi:hypothetical protein